MGLLSGTMRGELVRIIQAEILSNTYQPGQKILEEELSERLGISRTPVREALAVLEQQGLVVQKPHRGTFVATFSPDEIIDLLRVEAVLEGLAASLAAVKANAQRVEMLQQLTDNAEQTLSDYFDAEEFYRYDKAFHYQLVEASESPIINRIVEVQFAAMYLCRYYTITAPNRFTHSIKEHREIIHALREHNQELAEHTARNHLESVSSDYENYHKQEDTGNGSE